MITQPKFVNVLGFKVFSDKLDLISINNTPTKVITTISPNSYGISTKDADFNNALKDSDYLVLDGVYFALASILLQGKNIRRNQGPDLFYHFINRLQENKSKAFFLGSTPETLEKIKQKIRRTYSNVEVGYYSPPFRQEFTAEDNQKMVKAINEFKPDILFVGMTCPKQEKWSIQNKASLDVGLVISIGNVFDWFAGTQKIIHPIWYRLRIGWLIHIFLRPEIFKRNIANQMKFFTDVILMFLGLKRVKQ